MSQHTLPDSELRRVGAVEAVHAVDAHQPGLQAPALVARGAALRLAAARAPASLHRQEHARATDHGTGERG